MTTAKKNRARRNKARRQRLSEVRASGAAPGTQAPASASAEAEAPERPPELIVVNETSPANDTAHDPYEDPPFDPPDEDDEIFGGSSLARGDAAFETYPNTRAPSPANEETDEDPEAWQPANPPVQPPLPAITIHAYWDRPATAEAFAALAADPRCTRARIEIARGGLDGALAQLGATRAPDLLLLDSTLARTELFAGLAELTARIGPETRIALIGSVNDIGFFRELAARGVCEYFNAPVTADQITGALCALFAETDAARTIAVIGARGGAGASTLARNLAHAIAEAADSRAMLIDLDVHFGAAALACAHAPRIAIADALADENDTQNAPPQRGLCLLAAPAALDATELTDEALDALLAHARRQSPAVVLDLPHAWTHATRRALALADDVVIVARPDLASLRDAKNMLDQLRAAREGKIAPHVVLSMAGAPERPEIAAKDFAEVAGVTPVAIIAFDPVLHAACAVSGRMIAEAAPHAGAAYEALAAHITGVAPHRRAAPAPLVLHDIAERPPLDLTAPAPHDDYLTRARRAALAQPYALPREEDDADFAPPPRRSFRVGRVAAMALVAALAVSGALYKRAGDGAVTLGSAEARAATVQLTAARLPQRAPQIAPSDDLASLYAQAHATQNEADSHALLQRAADGGFAPAHYQLAKRAERAGDLTAARRATERAALLGNTRAMHDLGVYAARGEGGPRDDAAAYRWFRAAAELGVAESQYNLGVLHAEGRGAPADTLEALFWFNVAARFGEDASARIAALEAQVTPLDIEQARARTRTFHTRPPSPGANAL